MEKDERNENEIAEVCQKCRLYIESLCWGEDERCPKYEKWLDKQDIKRR